MIVAFFDKLTKAQKILVLVIVAVVLYTVSAGISFSLFSKSGLSSGRTASNNTTPLPGAGGIEQEDPSLPKTEACPLNGELHTRNVKTESQIKKAPATATAHTGYIIYSF